jgi:hypothetical protein
LAKITKLFFSKDKMLYVCEMLVTIEQQQAMIEVYAKTHTTAEVVGFIDGLIAMLDLIERVDKNGG